MAVFRYRSVDEMPPPWRDTADPGNLRTVCEVLRSYRLLAAVANQPPGVHRYRSIEALNADRGDPYRCA